MGFRDDINGLRAIAVAIVVLYHFRVGIAPGGFAGVDVFFVISGFLMTQIIMGRIARERFSLLEFYGARVRRIVPAMAVLVAATFGIGVAVLNPLRLESLARSAFTSLLFVSNIHYAHETGYFSAPPDDNWLIHTWSLSVEWQFYMLYPLALMALTRLGLRRRGLVAVALGVAALSFALMVRNWTAGGGLLQQGFFLLPSRIWEFLAGGLVVLAGPRLALGERARIALHASGLALVAAGVALVDRTSRWPSPVTLVCVLGTSLVLLAGCERAGWTRLAPVHALGKWSYSIYLWHWPIVAILAYAGLAGPGWTLGGIGLSVLCGWASYALVETRLTTMAWDRGRMGRPAAGAVFAVLIALALMTAQSNGLERVKFAGRPDILAALADTRAARDDWSFPKTCDRFQWDSATNISRCAFGDPAAHDTLVIGDSFAEQLTPRFSHALRTAGVTFVTLGGCMPMPGVERPTPGMNCGRFVDRAYAIAADSPYRRIVVTAFWPGYGRDNLCVGEKGACTPLDAAAFAARLHDGYHRMAARWRALREAGKQVIVVDVPPYGDEAGDPTRLYDRAIAGHPVTTLTRSLAGFKAETHDTSALLAEAARDAGVTLVDPAPGLCPDGRCPLVVDGHAQYKDGAHLRASILSQPRFSIYDRIIAPAALPRSASAKD